MKKITILLLHMQFGGIEKQTITLANELSRKYKVNIISTYDMESAPAYPLNDNISVKYLINGKPNKEEFKSAVRNKQPVEIIKQAFKAIKILYLKRKLMINEIKKLDCDFVLSTRIEFANMLSKYAPKHITTLTQEHLHNDSRKYVSRIKSSFKNLDYLIVLCDGSEKNYSNWLKNNKKIKIEKIPNILEYIPSETALLEGNNLIAVGRLHPVKNFEALIKVYNSVQKTLPDAKLTIVGGGEEMEKLQSLAQELGLQNKITITGMVSKNDVENYMLSSDIYVMTSLTECFPMVLLEASSVGLPLISFDVPVGPKSIIENDKNGYLITDGDIDAMAEKILSVLADRNKLKNLGKCAKEYSSRYLPENVLEKWYQIFDK